MDKVKIDFQIPEKIKVDYRGQEIELIPFITIPQQIYLINEYVNDYYNDLGKHFIEKDKYNYLEAEFNMVSYLTQLLTNVDPDISHDMVGDNEYISLFEENVENYNIFRKRLLNTLNSITNQIEIENSIGPIMAKLVNKGYDILESFSELEPEDIEKLQNKSIDMLKQLDESSLIKESSQRKKG